MKESIAEAIALFAALDVVEPALAQAAHLALETLRSGHKILVCGNGGSACDAQHLAGELVGRYKQDRRGPCRDRTQCGWRYDVLHRE